jgi:UDP-2,3-diacylglucosamine pyrophosphatase LpxH
VARKASPALRQEVKFSVEIVTIAALRLPPQCEMKRVQAETATRTNCMAHWRTGWISDFHLGVKGTRAGMLLDFLRENDFEKLYLVGDIIDVLALRRGIFWPQEHNDVIQKLLRKGRKGTELIYIPGNHDGFVTGYLGTYGSVTLQKHAIHTTADGKRILVFHGHELDTLVQNLGWLGHVGDVGYTVLLRGNGVVNLARRLLGLDPWSLSAYVKGRVRNVAKFIWDSRGICERCRLALRNSQVVIVRPAV